MTGLLCVSIFFTVLSPRVYHVSPKGNDSLDGLTPQTAWKTLNRVSQAQFVAGDHVELEPGALFEGPLSIGSSGSPTAPIVIEAKGSPATITSNKGSGITVRGGGIELKNLNLKGFSVKKEDDKVGVLLDAPGTHPLKHVTIWNLDITGFGGPGISITSAKGAKPGFQDVTISNTRIHGNHGVGISTSDGIAFDSKGEFYAHKNLLISDCDVSNNLEGNGIILSGWDGALVQFSRASGNRSDGGALGMWAWCAKNVTFRYCIVSGTRGPNDAGGFDLDGGTVNCVVDHCLSFDNDGPGYMHCDFTDAPRTHGNVMRNSVSVNDGRKSRGAPYGFGFVVWGTGLYDCRIEQNLTVVTQANPKSPVNGANFVCFIRSDRLPLSAQRLEGGVFKDNRVIIDDDGPWAVWDNFPVEQPAKVSYIGNTYLGTKPIRMAFEPEKSKRVLTLDQWHALGNDVAVTRAPHAPKLGDLQNLKPRDLPRFFKDLSHNQK